MLFEKILNKISTFLKDYWNLYAPPIISTLIAWLVDWNAGQMQTINQYIGVTISLICVLTMFKFLIFPNKKKNIVEQAVSSQKSVRNMETGINPVGKIDETIVLIETGVKGGKKTMEKIKKFFKWIWYYKEQLIGLIEPLLYATLVVYMYICDKFGFILNYLPDTMAVKISVKVIFGVLSAVFIFYTIRNQVKWVGVGSVATATEYLNKIIEKITSGSTLSDKTKTKIKEILKQLSKSLKNAEVELEKCKIAYNKAVDEVNVFEDFRKNGLSYDNDEYNKSLTKVQETNNAMIEAQTTLDSLQAKIEQYEKALEM